MVLVVERRESVVVPVEHGGCKAGCMPSGPCARGWQQPPCPPSVVVRYAVRWRGLHDCHANLSMSRTHVGFVQAARRFGRALRLQVQCRRGTGVPCRAAASRPHRWWEVNRSARARGVAPRRSNHHGRSLGPSRAPWAIEIMGRARPSPLVRPWDPSGVLARSNDKERPSVRPCARVTRRLRSSGTLVQTRVSGPSIHVERRSPVTLEP